MQNCYKGEIEMADNAQFVRPESFRLDKDGDTAVVRLLHNSISTIESQLVHTVQIDGKFKKIKCLGKDCPLCESPDYKTINRIYIRLWNYDVGKEQLWDRTDKILPELEKIQNSWSPLYSAVLRVTRKGDEFPKYEFEVLNPIAYGSVDVFKDKLDQPIAKFCSMSRKKEDLEEFMNTGKLPEKKKFVSREEYNKMKQEEKEGFKAISESKPISPVGYSESVTAPVESVSEPEETNSPVETPDFFDPFGDDFITRV